MEQHNEAKKASEKTQWKTLHEPFVEHHTIDSPYTNKPEQSHNIQILREHPSPTQTDYPNTKTFHPTEAGTYQQDFLALNA